MNYLGRFVSNVRGFYSEINSATLTGAIDVVVIRQLEDGSYIGSPFHVRFGKLGVIRNREKIVNSSFLILLSLNIILVRFWSRTCVTVTEAQSIRSEYKSLT